MIQGRLLASTMLAPVVFVLAAPAAFAQDEAALEAASTQDAATSPGAKPQEVAGSQESGSEADSGADNDIVVTGSLFRRTNAETPSPVTVLSSETLAQRGINTVAEALQRVSANGAGAVTQGWNNGNNFATGANAASLRGLTVQSTLTIFDGLRMAPYPLADDGHRNFVDLNTIPSSIIDRIEVLRDGASSTYGADAVAGVINVITKKQVTGLHLNGSAGISQRGDAGERRIDATWGYGDLERQGFNFYINAEYQRQDVLWARDRDYPFNTTNFSSDCAPSVGRAPGTQGAGDLGVPAGTIVCRANGIQNSIRRSNTPAATLVGGLVFNGLFATPVPIVRGVGQPDPVTGAVPNLTRYNLLNTADGCRGFTPVNVPQNLSATAGPLQCSRDNRALYASILPAQERFGGTFRITANLGDRAQFHAMANYYQVSTDTQANPVGFTGTTPPPTQFAFASLYLPVYVCSSGVGSTTMLNTGCTAANGRLNPNNPFAAAGNRAQILATYDRPRELSTKARSLRGAMGISGSFGDDWAYQVEGTVSNVRLDVINRNVLIPQRVLDVVAQGSYNFVNPSFNTEAIRDYIAPLSVNRSNSDLWQASATLSKALFELPGGPLQAAIGAAYRHESIDNPSANPANAANPASRYYVINAVGAIGSRNVKSAYFEINAPIVEQLEINASGRYDDYSSGQSNFSPKIGAKFTPIPQLAVRGTYSKGFRIPSFNEAYGLPTTGFVTRQLNASTPGYAQFVAAHGGNQYATTQFAVGQTNVGNAALAPEKSTSWTVGAIFEPVRNVSFTIDYYNIEVRDLIANATYNIDDVFAQYYSNNGVVNIPGIRVTPGVPDVSFPNALPHIGFIEASFENTDSQRVSGIDLGASVRLPITDHIALTSIFDASYTISFKRVYADRVEEYAGTLSPCDVTSCSGAPRWRGSWQNTLQAGGTSVSLTAYYTSGYDLASIDYGGVKGDCFGNIGASVVTYEDGVTPVQCTGGATWNVDMALSQKVGDRFTLYANVLNILDLKPPVDPSAAYSIFQYNPAWAGANVLGRYFRVGARMSF
ncbi:MAG: TonB-dependent receptor [Sphingomonas sp.]|uniref:TonB-dependent receptor domain-containing protein n=1 Tax=Sphingomonas sp. TaxID=28214 RepID=UPI002274C384|nr:TonB-dependent receptor [Sphingomonas sp.]MCX8477243.1 TonB-dependent receptor [Sphingomonas sp.]